MYLFKRMMLLRELESRYRPFVHTGCPDKVAQQMETAGKIRLLNYSWSMDDGPHCIGFEA